MQVFGHVSPARLSAFDLVDGQDFSADDASHFRAVMIITKGTVRVKHTLLKATDLAINGV